jgi:hypothetical protein
MGTPPHWRMRLSSETSRSLWTKAVPVMNTLAVVLRKAGRLPSGRPLGDGGGDRKGVNSGVIASRKNSESGTDNSSRPSSTSLAASQGEMSAMARVSACWVEVLSARTGTAPPTGRWIQAWVNPTPPHQDPR